MAKGKRQKKGYTPPSPHNRAWRKRQERSQQVQIGAEAPDRGEPVAGTGRSAGESAEA